ncbi:hypothetical protein RP20_CCG025039 [Aedes albopictus]|nr:hypothetical protein RP20_CCG025039 [Aedes albopictus]
MNIIIIIVEVQMFPIFSVFSQLFKYSFLSQPAGFSKNVKPFLTGFLVIVICPGPDQHADFLLHDYICASFRVPTGRLCQ